jgi:tRNA(Arg) A34 adenosine deaminase TadA
MCSMALIHSRIKRVYFVFPTNYGYLNTICKLHCLSSLNHKFEVFKVIDLEESYKKYFDFFLEEKTTQHPNLKINIK